MSTKTLGEKIVLYRRTLGLTQEQLARRLAVDPGTLAQWEQVMDVVNSLLTSLFSDDEKTKA